jgi:hypothetical protein
LYLINITIVIEDKESDWKRQDKARARDWRREDRRTGW